MTYDKDHPYYTKCHNCGGPCKIPFQPQPGQKIYCKDCYDKLKEPKSVSVIVKMPAQKPIKEPKRFSLKTIVLIATILFALLSSVGAFCVYSAYQEYQPLIGYYHENVTAMNNKYDSINIQYTSTQSPDVLSQQWITGYDNELIVYTSIHDKISNIASSLKNCPIPFIVDTNEISVNDQKYSDNLKKLVDYEYLPLIGYYKENASAMRNAYSNSQKDSPNVLSDQWVSNYDGEITTFAGIHDKVSNLGSLIKNCPYVFTFYKDTDTEINADDQWYKDNLKKMVDYEYQPLINNYHEYDTNLEADYTTIDQKYLHVQRSSPDFLSDQWISNFNNEINNFVGMHGKVSHIANLLKSCPYISNYYTLSELADSEQTYNNDLKMLNDYNNAPYHTVEVWEDDNTYVVFPNNQKIDINVYRFAKDPTYDQLMNFLSSDGTIRNTYVSGQYVCANFAVDLYEHAESRLIRAHLVTITFTNGDGHMIDMFHTSDRGDIYIDDTGNTADDKARGAPNIPSTVNPVVGQAYIPKYIFSTNWYHTSIGTVKAIQQLS